MIDKKDIITIAKHAFKRSRGIPDKRIIHPRREWALGLIFFTLVLFGGSLLSAFSFSEFKDITTDGGEATIDVPKYNETLILNTIDFYQNKNQTFDSLTNNYEAVIEVNPPVPAASSTSPIATSTEETVADEAELETEVEIEPENSPEEETEPTGPISFE